MNFDFLTKLNWTIFKNLPQDCIDIIEKKYKQITLDNYCYHCYVFIKYSYNYEDWLHWYQVRLSKPIFPSYTDNNICEECFWKHLYYDTVYYKSQFTYVIF